jgi:hypothetical protein
MAQINKPTDYFNTKLYTGNGTDDHAITGVGFQPDWVWIKDRDSAYNHGLFDVIRGATKILSSNATSAEATTEGVKSFDSDGFTLGTGAFQNNNNDDFASWNWLAGGTASSNTDGSITTQVSANTTAGFSVLTYTGNGTAGATIGHGLNQAPEAFISKVRNQTNQWHCGFAPLGWTKQIHIDTTGAATSSTIFNNTAPDSSVVTLGSSSGTNWSGNTFVAYCFHSVKGYSKIGSYTGNGSTDGTFVYTGFKPAFVLIKANAVADWYLIDNKRATYNVMEASLKANTSDAESTTIQDMDFLSNGFKPRSTSGSTNGSGTTYIYMAFAENPLVGTNNIPATAR